VQDVIIKLYLRRDELTSIRELEPWLGRVLYNQFIDDRRRYRRQPLRLVDANVAIDEQVASHAEPLARAMHADTTKRLLAALARLSEEHRVVVMLHDAEGYKIKEIQELTGIPAGTVKSRLHRGREHLRALLNADGTFSVPAACSPLNGVNVDAM